MCGTVLMEPLNSMIKMEGSQAKNSRWPPGTGRGREIVFFPLEPAQEDTLVRLTFTREIQVGLCSPSTKEHMGVAWRGGSLCWVKATTVLPSSMLQHLPVPRHSGLLTDTQASHTTPLASWEGGGHSPTYAGISAWYTQNGRCYNMKGE